MNIVDSALLSVVNQYARHSHTFDAIVHAVAFNHALKGGMIVAVCWWVWFDPRPSNNENRRVILAAFASAVAAVVVGRLMADFLPFRLRPVQASNIGFVLPYGMTVDYFRGWSSFPSDHAMAFFAIATSLWFVSRALGALVSLYVFVIILLPRVYLGLHYPSDILGGMAIGTSIALALNLGRIRMWLSTPALHWMGVHPASFYVCFLAFSNLMATLFDPIRHSAAYLIKLW